MMAAIVGFATHATDYYLVGTFNNWTKGDNYKFTQINNEWYSYAYKGEFTTNETFQITDGTNNWYGGGGNQYPVPVSGGTYDLTSSQNTPLAATVTNPVFFFKSGDSHTLRVVSMPSQMYILGNINGGSFVPTNSVAMTQTDNSFSAVVTINDSANGYGLFTLAAQTGTGWDAVNGGDRFGAANEGDILEESVAASVTCYPKDICASAAKSWKIKAGAYNITVNFAGTSGIEVTATPVESAYVIEGSILNNEGKWLNQTIQAMTKDDEGNWTANLQACYKGSFGLRKVLSGSTDKVDWVFSPSEQQISGNTECEAVLESKATGYNWNITEAGNYTFKFNPSTMTLTVTKEELAEPYVIYFQTPDNFGTPHIWAWGKSENGTFREGQFFIDAAWPGDEMQLVEGNVYKWSTKRGVPNNMIISNENNWSITKFENDPSLSTESGHLYTDAEDEGLYAIVKSVVASATTSESSVTIEYTVDAKCDYDVQIKIDTDLRDSSSSPFVLDNLDNGTHSYEVIVKSTDGKSSASTTGSFTIGSDDNSQAQSFKGSVSDKVNYNGDDYSFIINYQIISVDNNLKFVVNIDYQEGFGLAKEAVYADIRRENGATTEIQILPVSAKSAAKAAAQIDFKNTGTLEGATTSGDYTDGEAITVGIKFNYTDAQYSTTISEYSKVGTNGTSFVNNVAVDSTDAPVEYYNLQGVKINGELAPGIYIRRQGNDAAKVVIR